MADTHYLKTVVEPFITKWVSKQIKLLLKPKKMPVGPGMDGKMVNFEFDGVSQDEQTALLVSTSYSFQTGVIRKLFVDAAILLRTKFNRRIMAFVSNDVLQTFINRCDGLLPLGQIEFLLCDSLPPEMVKEMAKIHTAAKTEVGDKGKQRKTGGRRR